MEYIRTGKCKHNHEGRVVLLAGEMVPRHITGAWLRNRINEYHRQNPGQIRAATMLFEIAQHDAPPPTYAMGQPCYPVRHVNQYSMKDTTDAFAIHRPPRLCPKVVITTLPPHKRGCSGPSQASKSISRPTPSQEAEDEEMPTQETAPAAKKGKTVTFVPEPEHPYAKAPDATYRTIPGPFRPVVRDPPIR